MKSIIVSLVSLLSINAFASRSNQGAPESAAPPIVGVPSFAGFVDLTGQEKINVGTVLFGTLKQTRFNDCDMENQWDRLMQSFTGHEIPRYDWGNAFNQGFPAEFLKATGTWLHIYRNPTQPVIKVEWLVGNSGEGMDLATIEMDVSRTRILNLRYEHGGLSLINSGGTLDHPVMIQNFTVTESIECSVL